jgi:PKD repeat protein
MRPTACALALGLALCIAAPAAATTLPSGFGEVDMTTGALGSVTAVAFAPDGRRFLAEKGGRVRVATASGAVLSTPLLDLRAKVNSFSDRGLLGIAADKDFATNGYLYLLYVYELNPMVQDTDAPMVSRLTRVTVNPDNTVENPTNPETVILGKDVSGPCPQPDNLRDCIPADYKWHVIGTVRSDPVDGTLWVGNGDTHPHAVDASSYRPYDENTLAGKIIHIDRQGRGLAGHPFCPQDANLDHVCTKIHAKGFRNPFRFALRPGKGPVVGDVGASAREEIDLIQPGRNYGWPCYEGDVRTPLYDEEPRCLEEYAKEGTAAAATPPSWSYPHGTGASVIAGPVYDGTRYPADYRGDIFVGDYVQGWVKRLEVGADDRVMAVYDFATGWPTGVDLQTVPGSGDIAYADLGYGGPPAGVRRFEYTGAANAAPTAAASATPTSGAAPLAVSFSAAGSTDPDGDPLTYLWQFGDGSAPSGAANPSHTYTADGTYTATLTVDDGNGHPDSDTVAITVGNAAPSATITEPVDESLYRGGVAVALRGSASDREDPTLPESAYAWRVLLHHGSHVHEHSSATGSQASFVPATDHDADSYYEVRLTVTDSGGLSHTTTADVRPQTSRLTLASSPAGAPVDYVGAQSGPAPFTRIAAVGYRATISAAESFVRDGVTYGFSSWSDGGARQHEVTVGAADSTLTATYVPAGTQTLTFTPEADTWVDATRPSTSFGTSSRMDVDTSPLSQSFVRFRVAGIDGRAVLGARLRLYQRDASRTGGRVFAMSSNTWLESMTWNTRPAIDGAQLAAFGAVTAGNYYEVDLGARALTGDGPLSLGLDSTSSDGASWGTRSYTEPPQLIVEVQTAGNGAPTAVATATPTAGAAPLAVSFSGGASTDPDGDVLSHRWEFGDGSATSNLANPSHTYTAAGTYTATLTVDDGQGHTDSDTVVITVGSASAPETLAFTPEADTWVDASRATSSFGSSTQMRVDTSPASQSFLRFRVAGLAGRQIRGARLRLYQRDSSRTGGRVFAMSSTSWLESMTWNTRPAIDGGQLASFGAVSAGSYYEVALAPGTVTGEGALSLAMDSTSSDGSTWGTREYTQKPQLLVDVE